MGEKGDINDALCQCAQRLEWFYFLSYYEGHTPVLVTSDPDFIQEVFIKQFGNFIARKVSIFWFWFIILWKRTIFKTMFKRQTFQLSDSGPECDVFLSAKGQWKRMRNIINPTFSTTKLKEVIELHKRQERQRLSSEFFVLADAIDETLHWSIDRRAWKEQWKRDKHQNVRMRILKS